MPDKIQNKLKLKPKTLKYQQEKAPVGHSIYPATWHFPLMV
jgi:hypothetical protein